MPWLSCLGYRHAGCLQLSHRRPPEMCGLRTRPRMGVDPPRFLPPSNSFNTLTALAVRVKRTHPGPGSHHNREPPQPKRANRSQQGHAGSKTLQQQNPPGLNWRCRLTQVDLYNGRKRWLSVEFINPASTILHLHIVHLLMIFR